MRRSVRERIPAARFEVAVRRAEESLFYGVPMQQLDRQELLYVIAHLLEEQQSARQRHAAERRFLHDLRRSAR